MQKRGAPEIATATTEARALVARLVVVEDWEVLWTRQAQNRSEMFFAFWGLENPLLEGREFMPGHGWCGIQTTESWGEEHMLCRVYNSLHVVLRLDASGERAPAWNCLACRV